METKVIKRRGRPNRGGGRHNRGGRGRGRGRGTPTPEPPKPRGSTGIGGRKSGANLFDDDDIYDAYEDDGDSYDFGQGMPNRIRDVRKDFARGASRNRGCIQN